MPSITVWTFREANASNITFTSLIPNDKVFNIEVPNDVNFQDINFPLKADLNQAQRIAWSQHKMCYGFDKNKIYINKDKAAKSPIKAYAYLLEVDDITLSEIRAQIRNSQPLSKYQATREYQSTGNNYGIVPSETYKISFNNLFFKIIGVLNSTTNGDDDSYIEKNKRLFGQLP